MAFLSALHGIGIDESSNACQRYWKRRSLVRSLRGERLPLFVGSIAQAGLFFLKAASLELGIQEALVETSSRCRLNSTKSANLELPHNRPLTLCQRYETLMFYCLLQGRRRPCPLKSYNASDLLALTGQSYAFATLDDPLRDAMTLQLSGPIGDALARQYYRTWYQTNAAPQESLEPYVFYLDAHEKPVFCKEPVPVGMIKGHPGTCLRQVFLHGRRGPTLVGYQSTLSKKQCFCKRWTNISGQ